MSNSYFRFKQFEIQQSDCAMKVGTDGVLIGAWCGVEGVSRSLDVGTGSGLIALMVAQRCAGRVDAVEIDETAFRQAGYNISRSPWADRVTAFHANFSDFQPPGGFPYDLIVSNPPYFERSLLPENEGRKMARHCVALTYDTFFSLSRPLLARAGRVALIYPADADLTIGQAAERNQFHLLRKTFVKGMEHLPVKRVMSEWGFESVPDPVTDLLIIEHEPLRYTAEYIGLTREFYLKM